MMAEQFAQAADDVVAQAEAVLVDAMFDEIVTGLRLGAAAAERAAPSLPVGDPGHVPGSPRQAVPASPDAGSIRSPPRDG